MGLSTRIVAAAAFRPGTVAALIAALAGLGASPPPSPSPAAPPHPAPIAAASTDVETEVYCGGSLYSGGDAVIRDLRGSGFTTVIAWSVHVRPDGALVLNDREIVAGGAYTGDPAWPGRLRDLKTGGTVRTLLFSVGAWGTPDFATIAALIRREGTGPGSALYRSFQALKRAVPVDGIDLDDEDDYDPDAVVRFSRMLLQLGYHVTFCPYRNRDFWIACARSVDASGPPISALNLQCYAGGSRNDPTEWVRAVHTAGLAIPVYAGLWSLHGDACGSGLTPAHIQDRITRWRPSGIRGAFLWQYDDVRRCGPSTAAYAKALHDGLVPS